MSWDGIMALIGYIDTLAQSHIARSAIISRDGSSIWAISSDFKLSPTEMSEIAQAFDNPAKVLGSGVHANGQKFFTLSVDDRIIRAQMQNKGIIAIRTKQAILISNYDEKIIPVQAATVTERLADYLIGLNY